MSPVRSAPGPVAALASYALTDPTVVVSRARLHCTRTGTAARRQAGTAASLSSAHRQPDSRNETRTCASASALCSALPCPTSTCMSASVDSFFPSSSRPFLACPPRGLYISLVPHLISIHHHHLRSISSAACATLPFTSHRNTTGYSSSFDLFPGKKAEPVRARLDRLSNGERF